MSFTYEQYKTLRIAFIRAAMQGIAVAADAGVPDANALADRAVKYADATIQKMFSTMLSEEEFQTLHKNPDLPAKNVSDSGPQPHLDFAPKLREVEELLRSSTSKAGAIKRVREIIGPVRGLREAKDFVDVYTELRNR